jgi:hypothetical protein
MPGTISGVAPPIQNADPLNLADTLIIISHRDRGVSRRFRNSCNKFVAFHTFVANPIFSALHQKSVFGVKYQGYQGEG